MGAYNVSTLCPPLCYHPQDTPRLIRATRARLFFSSWTHNHPSAVPEGQLLFPRQLRRRRFASTQVLALFATRDDPFINTYDGSL